MAEAALKQPEGIEQSEVEAIAGGPVEKPAPRGDESTVDPKQRAEKPEKKAKAEEPKTVPHEAFHEERTKRQQAEKRFREFEKEQAERNARLEARLEMLQTVFQPQQPPKAPELAKDPLGYVRTLEQRVAAQEQETAAQKQAREKAETQQQEEGNLWSNYRAAGREFTQTNPDFMDAYNHLLNSRVEELRIFNDGDENAIRSQLKADEFALAQMAFQSGKNPAEIIYKWAKQRGYQPGQKPQGQANGNGAPQPQPSAIDRLRDAQDASETLSKGGSPSADSGRITLDSLYRMSDGELNAFIRKMNSKDPEGYEKLKRRLEGGN